MRKLGIIAGSAGVDTLASLPLIQKAGFDSFFTGYSDRETMKTISDRAKALGLSYETVHAPFEKRWFGGVNEIWRAGENGENYLKLLIANVEVCAENEIPTLIIHLSSGVNAPCVNDLGHERFDRLVGRAGELGVMLAFENQRKLANLAFTFENYAENPFVGFCWDNGHEACFTNGIEFMPLFGKKTVALHLHDNHAVFDQDEHLLPFDGGLDWNKIAGAILASGYQGSLMLEGLPGNSHFYDGMNAADYYARAYESASRLRKLMEEKSRAKV